MEPTDVLLPASGSISDIAVRLALWGRRAPHGLARVEFDSDFSRQKVIEQLRVLLVEADIPFYEIDLPQETPAPDIVSYLKDQFAPLPHSIVSITGWATAFPKDIPFQESLRVLNYNRENLAQFPQCQVWWTTRTFTDSMLHEIPDLASWFILRLSLTENIARREDIEKPPLASQEQQDAARYRATVLQERFQNALKANMPIMTLVDLAIAANNQLEDVGLGHEMSSIFIQQLEQLPAYKELQAGTSSLKDRDQMLIFNALARLYKTQNQYDAAETFLKRALPLIEKISGQENKDTANILNNLAYLYEAQGRYQDAEPLYKRALEIREQALGPNHPDTAISLNNLAALYYNQGHYADAELLYKRALEIQEQTLGSSHLGQAASLNNLAALYRSQGRYAEAEPLHKRALELTEQELGLDHPNTATSLNNLAALYYSQGYYQEAEPLYQRALAIQEQALGPNHPKTAASLNNLALLYHHLERYQDAEPLYQRALAIREQTSGSSHPNRADILNNLASLYDNQGRYQEAKPLFEQALAIFENVLGAEHPTTIEVKENYARLLENMRLAGSFPVPGAPLETVRNT